ncbi:transcriptional regulator GlxA family with amidase domain [Microbacterium resistens]|uniref:Transcriptional regulator GlxA family with amidase domain n=1 Tax=Microbacterium resistens TaxID=156977 RepID=A0ABU1SEP0_9MICO|nr:helix-turn-helix domain-containing protein [Microbacterium resistens]MDR6868075.1 transcriptional regulator GlxA family with amidase domain [Microbacterium resistens]
MRTVAVLAFPGISPFHLSVPHLVFGRVGIRGADSPYRLVTVAERPGAIRTGAGYDMLVADGLARMTDADMVVIPSWDPGTDPSPQLLDAVRAAHERGARIVGLCLGAYVVAASGIAAGREITTHWSAGEHLGRAHPGHRIRCESLWTDLGDVVTSAGVAAALDCCLHIVRTELGSAVAGAIARELVLAPHRDGSQAQFLAQPLPADADGDEIDRAMGWAMERLTTPTALDEWAGSVHLSRRTFTRRFRERTGTSPGDWLLTRRLDEARRLLEATDLPLDAVANAAGFGTAVTLRHHFRERLGTTPAAHRRAFAE